MIIKVSDIIYVKLNKNIESIKKAVCAGKPMLKRLIRNVTNQLSISLAREVPQ
jgi:hypothetical protein